MGEIKNVLNGVNNVLSEIIEILKKLRRIRTEILKLMIESLLTLGLLQAAYYGIVLLLGQ